MDLATPALAVYLALHLQKQVVDYLELQHKALVLQLRVVLDQQAFKIHLGACLVPTLLLLLAHSAVEDCLVVHVCLTNCNFSVVKNKLILRNFKVMLSRIYRFGIFIQCGLKAKALGLSKIWAIVLDWR